MSISSLTGKDTIIINDRVFTDFADGDVASFAFPNELATSKVGKNGNSIVAFNETGKQVDLTLRVLLGSPDDKFLNSLKLSMESDFPSFTLLTGEFTKRAGDGLGNVSNIKLTLGGGFFAKNIDTKDNAEGDTEQSVGIYSIKFTNTTRAIA